MTDLDFGRARWDVAYFSESFLGVVPHAGQRRLFDAYLARDASGWRPAYLNIAVSAGNRAGKTLGLAILIMHSCIFKIGLRPPGADDRSMLTWLKAPYVFFHFGISTEVAGLVHNEIAMLLSGVHPAQQGRGCPLADQAEAQIADYQTKDQGMWPMVQFNPALGGATIRFRTTGERAISSLGRDMNGISFDECGFEPHLQFIVDEVLDLRRLGTGGQLLLISTPTAGLTEFADLWAQGDPEEEERRAGFMSLRMSTRENIGYGIDQGIFDRLVEGMAPDLIAQNIDGHFIRGEDVYFHYASVNQAFTDQMPEAQGPRDGHVYVQGVDPGSKDKTWSLVFDVSWRPAFGDPTREEAVAVGVKCSVTRGQLSTPEIVAMVVADHAAYDRPGRYTCDTALDTTGHGGHMFREEVEARVPQVQSVEFGGTALAKRSMLSDVKTMLDTGRLRMPAVGDWLEVRNQFRRYKLADKKIEQDAVMAVAVAVKAMRRARPMSSASVSFDARLYDVPEPTGDAAGWINRPYEHPRRRVAERL